MTTVSDRDPIGEECILVNYDNEPETEGCGDLSPRGYRCTHHNATEHLARGIEPDSLGDSWCRHERTRIDGGISSCLDCGDRIDTDADDEAT